MFDHQYFEFCLTLSVGTWSMSAALWRRAATLATWYTMSWSICSLGITSSSPSR